MRFVAVYRSPQEGVVDESDLSLLRRIKAPFSTLVQRGHPFGFMGIETFLGGLAYSADVTILPNWVFTDEEFQEYSNAVSQGNLFVYDLSDPRLLDAPVVWRTMQQASLVTVPNLRLKKEIEASVGSTRVVVTPSCLDVPYFMEARDFPMPQKRVIGCFGPYDWSLVRDAIAAVKEQQSSVSFVGGRDAAQVLGELVEYVPLSIGSYPVALHSTLFGLCPSTGDSERDDFWRHEYGILCRPTIQLQGEKQQSTQKWIDSMYLYLSDDHVRSSWGRHAFEQANAERNTLRAGEWLRTFQKKLPYIASVA